MESEEGLNIQPQHDGVVVTSAPTTPSQKAACASTATENSCSTSATTENAISAAVTKEKATSAPTTTQNANSAPTTTQNLPISVVKSFTGVRGRIMATATVPGSGVRSVTVQVPQHFAAPFLRGTGPVAIRFKTNKGTIIEGKIVKTSPIPSVLQNPSISTNSPSSASQKESKERGIQVPSSNLSTTIPISSVQTPWIPIPTNAKQTPRVTIPLIRPVVPFNSLIPTQNPQMRANSQIPTQNPLIRTQNPIIPTQNPQMRTNSQIPTQNLLIRTQNLLMPTNSQITLQNPQISARNPQILTQIPLKLINASQSPQIMTPSPPNTLLPQQNQLTHLAVSLPPVLSPSDPNPQIPTASPNFTQISTLQDPIPTFEHSESEPWGADSDTRRVCVICGPIPGPVNPKRYMGLGLSAKLFSKREISVRAGEGLDLSFNPTVYDVVDWLGVFMSEGAEGVKGLHDAGVGRPMNDSPLGIIKSVGEEPRRLCKECESAVKSSYLGLRHIMKRLHEKGALHAKFLANNQNKRVSDSVSASTLPLQTINDFRTEDNVAKRKRVRSVPVKKAIMTMISNKKRAIVFNSTIAQLIRKEMKVFVKNEDSCLKKYYDEDGFIPPDEMLAEEVGNKCPIVKKVVEALFLQPRGKEDWTRPMTAAFAIAANQNSARTNSMNALQKTVALACHRVGVPVTMYNFLSKLGISYSWGGTNKASFDIKGQGEGQKSSTSGPNLNPTNDPEIKEEPMDIDTSDTTSDPSAKIVPKKRIIVETEIDPRVIQSTVPVDDNVLIVGRNLPRRRLWPYRNVATDSAGQMLKGQAVKRRRIRRKNNQNLNQNVENLQNQIPKPTPQRASPRLSPKKQNTTKAKPKKINPKPKSTPQVQNQPQIPQKSAEEVRKAMFSQRLESHLKKLKGKKKIKVVAKKRKISDT